MLARAIATLDHILQGRLTINIISSNLPGTEVSSAARYQRSREDIEILKQASLEINAVQGILLAAFIFVPLYLRERVITVTQYIKKRLGKRPFSLL